MELLRLGSTIFKPLDVIEGWDSLIWTERYRGYGEFELRSYNIDEIINLLPTDDPTIKPQMVCLRDSREAMIVESHQITTDDKGREMVLTKGRTFETFLEQRVLFGLSNRPKKTQQGYTARGLVQLLIWNALVNNSTVDVFFLWFRGTNMNGDRIPNVAVSEGFTIAGTTNKIRQLETDYLYPIIVDLLSEDKLGIRNIRPNTASAKIVTVDPGTGNITRTTTSDVNDLCIEIYAGQDRTAGSATPVIFTASQNHLLRPRYLFTNKNLKNTGYGTSAVTFDYYYFDNGNEDTWTGLKRRVTKFDAGSRFGTNTGSASDVADADDFLTDKTERQVRRRQNMLYLDAEVSSYTSYEYGPDKDYFLGDKVTAIGKYGVNKTVRVSEYIRIHDRDGERAYPTLTFDGS